MVQLGANNYDNPSPVVVVWEAAAVRDDRGGLSYERLDRTCPKLDDMKSEKIAALLRFFFFFISCFAVTIKVRKSSSDMFHPLMLTNVLVEIK